jgi:predicted Zn-dependent protease
MGEPQRAIELLEEVVRTDPRRQRTGRYHLCLAYERAGRTEDARRVLAEVARMQEAETLRLALPSRPDDLALRVRTAEALVASGKMAEALDLLGQVLERDPAFRPAHALLARYYDKQGDKGRARAHRKLAGEGAGGTP